MAEFFTTEDVLRWKDAAINDIPRQLDALGKPGIPPDHRRQRYGHLAGDYSSLAMAAIGAKNFEEAKGLLRKSLEMKFESYEIVLANQGTVSAGDFQLVLLAFVTTDQQLISRMLDYYRWESGVPESVFLGKIIKSLAQGDINTAQATLGKKAPRIEKLFAAYPECLKAIAHKDGLAFACSISTASKQWAKWTSRHEKGLSDSVCFIQGVGLVRLAEKVLGQRLEICDENIPV